MYIVWSSVLYYTLFQVYQTAIVNPEVRKHDYFSEYIFFALPPQPVSQQPSENKAWNWMLQLSIVAQPPWGPFTTSDNKYRHQNGLRQQYFENSFVIHTRIHTYIHTFEFILYLWHSRIYFRQLFFTVQQYGSGCIAVLSLKGMENKNIYILRNKAVVSFGPVFFTDRTASSY